MPAQANGRRPVQERAGLHDDLARGVALGLALDAERGSGLVLEVLQVGRDQMESRAAANEHAVAGALAPSASYSETVNVDAFGMCGHYRLPRPFRRIPDRLTLREPSIRKSASSGVRVSTGRNQGPSGCPSSEISSTSSASRTGRSSP